MTSSRRASLLVVFAHPDDGSSMAARSCISVSRAFESRSSAPPTARRARRIHRSEQSTTSANCASQNLRGPATGSASTRCSWAFTIPHVVSASGTTTRALANVDMLEVEAAIRRVIEDVTPHVILTFDPHGGYYHPDHLAVQRATTAAFFSSGAMGALAPRRLFYATMLCEVFRGLTVKTRGRGIVDGLDPHVFGTASDMIAVSFDAAPFVQRKFLALAAIGLRSASPRRC